MCHHSKHNINLIVIPHFIAEGLGDISTHIVKRLSDLQSLIDNDVNLTITPDDIHRYILLNEKVLHQPSTSGTPLFQGFKSTLLEGEYMGENSEDYHSYKEDSLKALEIEQDEDHPHNFGLHRLGNIKPYLYSNLINTLVLVEDLEAKPYTEEDAPQRYHEWLTEILSMIGKYHSYDEICTTELFKEMMNPSISFKTVFVRELLNEA